MMDVQTLANVKTMDAQNLAKSAQWILKHYIFSSKVFKVLMRKKKMILLYFSQSVFFHFKVKKIHYQPLPNALDIIDCCDQPDYWPSWSKTPYGLKPLL